MHTTTAAVVYNARTDRWTLTSDFVHDVSGYRFRITAGFTFDLASVPRVVWRVIAPYELSIEAALIHDMLYRCGGCPEPWECRPRRSFTRAEVDRLFRDEMKCRGVAAWRRELAYTAVRLFGGAAWRGQ